MRRPYYSFVIPVLNEEKNVASLFKEIKTVVRRLKKNSEIIFVDDGSTDNTLVNLKKLKPIVIVVMRKNYGQSASLDAGIKTAVGKIVITLDGDGQNDPNDVLKMLNKINSECDVVCGWRKKRQDSWSKKFISRGAAFLRSVLVADGVHDAGCTLRVFKKECFDNIDLYGELHRMIPALLRWNGFKINEVIVNHRARKHGVTKYNWKRVIKGFIDMLYIWFWRKYENRPLYFFGFLGLLLTFFGSISLVSLLIGRLLGYFNLSNRIWPLMAIFMILSGFQLFTTGLLANFLIKNRIKGQIIPSYQIKKIIRKK